MANAIWDAPNDPQIYGLIEVPARPLLAFIDAARLQNQHITPTHLVGRALGHALQEVPSLNVRLVGDRAVPRGSIDVFFIVALAGGRELNGVRIRDIDRKSAASVAREVEEESQRLRQGRGAELERGKALIAQLPRPLLRLGLRLAAWAVGERG
jgi:pyruvate dehydrogenase E2 component (dihydrolipoamide acetyltransferase)